MIVDPFRIFRDQAKSSGLPARCAGVTDAACHPLHNVLRTIRRLPRVSIVVIRAVFFFKPRYRVMT